MRPQARPFSIEIKSRKRNTPPGISASPGARDDWIDAIPAHHPPERDVGEDLADADAHSEARREAERVFGRLKGQGERGAVAIKLLQANTDREIEAVFASLAQAPTDALLIGPGPFLDSRRKLLVTLAMKLQIPAAYETRATASRAV
jgi:hypothetical protein